MLTLGYLHFECLTNLHNIHLYLQLFSFEEDEH